MPNVKMKCRRGHSFTAYVATKYSKVECPECQRQARSSADSFTSSMVESVVATDFWSSSSDSSYSSSSSSDFSSGGGGDFGGGGSSGSWD
jgi:uncharacterized membrane protein YgcG